MTGIYNEFHYWSPVLGCDAVRLSMFDRQGSEFFMVVPDADGKDWRERKATSLEAIQLAIGQGCEPGEVVILEAADG